MLRNDSISTPQNCRVGTAYDHDRRSVGFAHLTRQTRPGLVAEFARIRFFSKHLNSRELSCPFMRHRQNITCRALMLVVVVLICGLGTPGISSRVLAQVAAKIAAPATNVPEPIYWKQNLFLIPYQWGSAAEPGAARAVWLFVSKDRGASWQKISEAKPDVKAFNYRAEGDGEYWFAVRTFDKLGRAWPQGPYQPELRVIVDTTLPRIDQLRARAADNGTIEIQGRASDANLDPSTWKLEWQANGMAAWQPVILPNTAADQHTGAATQASALPAPGSLLHASWHSPAGTKPTALRAIVTDRAGNSAMYQTRIESGTVVSGPLLAPPVVSTVTAPAVAPTQPVAGSNVAIQQTNPAAQGWGSVASASADNSRPISSGATPAPQPWPAGKVARAPFQLWTNGAKSPDDAVTAYGNPPLFNAPPTLASRSNEAQRELRVAAEYASVAKP
ncbi:MAG TPA: hypothetical protein VFW73_00625, partial [Lacipirellulaceae bacterium]|nr:hypothetical protein [Lacipirellulaceae bacterium]